MHAPIQTKKELLLVKEYMILPVMLEVLERDISLIHNVKFKFPHLYEGCLLVIQDGVTEQLQLVKSELRQHRIQVYQIERTKEYTQAKYRCRGYDYSLTLLWELVKAAIEVKLASYLNVRLPEPADPSGT